MKRFMLFSLIFISLISHAYSADLFSCRVSYGSDCDQTESKIFYLNKFFFNDQSKALSSKIAFNYNPTTYSSPICCKINKPGFDKINFNITVASNQACPKGNKEFLYFTDIINGKIGYPNSLNFNKLDYSNKLCIKIPKEFSSLDVLVNETDYSFAGYTCLFKTNSLQNSLVSSCDAKFLSTSQYKYTAWAKLWESSSSLKCNSDCTSKLDNRVYSGCGQKVQNCKNVPIVCNGAVLGSWVNQGNGVDVQCSSPWNNYKSKTFTNETVKISSNDESKCLNLIKKKYSVILNNELVTMNIYVCNN